MVRQLGLPRRTGAGRRFQEVPLLVRPAISRGGPTCRTTATPMDTQVARSRYSILGYMSIQPELGTAFLAFRSIMAGLARVQTLARSRPLRRTGLDCF